MSHPSGRMPGYLSPEKLKRAVALGARGRPMGTRYSSGYGFLGFLLRVAASVPLWFISTAIISYVLLKTIFNEEPPILDAITSLNLTKIYEHNLATGLPMLLISSFISLIIVWALFWRGE